MQQHQQREHSSCEVQWQGVRGDASAGVVHVVAQQRVSPHGDLKRREEEQGGEEMNSP